MTLVYLLRHGESEWNVDGLMQGQADPPLTEKGVLQARRAQEFIANMKFDRVVSSDLDRARQTAALVGFENAIQDPVWREINTGEWQGRKLEDLTSQERSLHQQWRTGDYTPQGGESWATFIQRVASGMASLNREADRVLVVCHAGVIRAALSSVLGIPPTALERPANLSLSVLRIARNSSLLGYNMTGPAIEDGDGPD